MPGSSRLNSRSGFTIVELLIVIVVIGVLAAISVVAYNGVQNRAKVSITKTDLSNNVKKLEEYRAVHDRYPRLTDSWGTWYLELKNAGVKFADFKDDEYYLAYCPDNNATNPDFVLVVFSPWGDYYRTGTQGSGEYTGPSDTLADVCSKFGFPTPPYDGWIKGSPGWAGGSVW